MLGRLQSGLPSWQTVDDRPLRPSFLKYERSRLIWKRAEALWLSLTTRPVRSSVTVSLEERNPTCLLACLPLTSAYQAEGIEPLGLLFCQYCLFSS